MPLLKSSSESIEIDAGVCGVTGTARATTAAAAGATDFFPAVLFPSASVSLFLGFFPAGAAEPALLGGRVSALRFLAVEGVVVDFSPGRSLVGYDETGAGGAAGDWTRGVCAALYQRGTLQASRQADTKMR